MNHSVMEDIRKYARQRMLDAFGFCGDASNDEMCMLNSSDHAGKDFIIKIEIKKDEVKE